MATATAASGVAAWMSNPVLGAQLHNHAHAHGPGGCSVCAAVSGQDAALSRRPALPLLSAAASGVDVTGPRPIEGKLVIQPDWVLAHENGELKLLENYDVIVEGDRILDVRERRAGNDPILPAPGQILMPSFISGHTHSCHGTLTRGFIEETPYDVIAGENTRSRPRSLLVPMSLADNLTDEELDDLTAHNLAEMLRTGCTTQVEMSTSFRQMQSYVRVATKFGMRGFPGAAVPGINRLLPIWQREGNQKLIDSEPATLAECAEVLAYSLSVNGSANGRIRPMITPTVTAVQTRGTFAALRAAAAKLGNGMHVHVQANFRPRDSAQLWDYWGRGKTEIDIMREVGLFEDRLFAAHMLGVDVEDLAELTQYEKLTVSHSPSGAGAGVLPGSFPYPEELAAGLNTSIGLDTHSNDFLENIKLSEIQSRGRYQLLRHTSPVPMKEVTIWDSLESATLGGARGLGRDDLGRIEAGAKADICTIAIDGFLVGSGARAIDPLNSLLYANGLAVRHVMTDGQMQVLDGQLLVGDQAEIMRKGGASVAKIWGIMRDQGYFDETVA